MTAPTSVNLSVSRKDSSSVESPDTLDEFSIELNVEFDATQAHAWGSASAVVVRLQDVSG